MADWSKIGRSSRQKGAAFERRCRSVMAHLTGHEHWKRTTAGHEQIYGDLMPCDENGNLDVHNSLFGKYIECKYRQTVKLRDIEGWIAEILQKSKGKEWLLLYGEPGGPVYVAGCIEVFVGRPIKAILTDDILGPFYVPRNSA